MNVLSLRISSVKCDDGSRINAEELIEIEMEDGWNEGLFYQNYLSPNQYYCSIVEAHKHLELINNATTTERQMSAVRKFAQLINSEEPEESNRIARKLVSVYFTSKIKHPVKSAIQR